MRLKAGALSPPMKIGLLSGGTAIPNLDNYSPVMVAVQGTTEVIRDSAPTVDAEAGTVAHKWVAGETDTVGRMFWTVEVDFGDGLVIFLDDGPAGVTDIE